MKNLIHVLLFSLISISCAFGQQYHAFDKVEIISQGQSTQTVIESEQLVINLNMNANQLSCMMKTGALMVNANPQIQRLLEDVFSVSTNYVLSFKSTVSSLQLGQMQRVPTALQFNGKTVNANAEMTVVKHPTDGDKLQLSYELKVSLSDLGLSIPRNYQNQFSNTFSIVIKEVTLASY